MPKKYAAVMIKMLNRDTDETKKFMAYPATELAFFDLTEETIKIGPADSVPQRAFRVDETGAWVEESIDEWTRSNPKRTDSGSGSTDQDPGRGEGQLADTGDGTGRSH